MYLKLTHRVRRPGRTAVVALGLLLSIATVAGAAPSPTPTPTFDPNNPQDKKLAVIFQRFDAKRNTVESTLQTVAIQLAQIENRLVALRAQLAKSEAELAKRQAQLTAAIAKLNAQKLLLKNSAAQIYMRGPWSYLDAMLNAEDISSMARVDIYSQSVLGDFIRTLREVTALKAHVEKLFLTVRKHTLDLRTQTAVVAAQEQQIMQRQAAVFAQRQQLINGLVADFGGLAQLKAHGFDIIIRAEAGASNRITAEFTDFQKVQDARASAQGGPAEDVAKTGQYVLQWPVDSRQITSRYGWRIHPLWGYRSFHTGIDIGADYGAPIKAVADGVVVDAAYLGADGLAVLIDHDHSISTVYAHMSRTQVQKGDVVKAGDVIGAVGCSGWCTGPHIHFEVRVASQPQNPMFWL
jgi:murein DD-endopeptidase MepM/ murein hydrolase activator NlpD